MAVNKTSLSLERIQIKSIFFATDIREPKQCASKKKTERKNKTKQNKT